MYLLDPCKRANSEICAFVQNGGGKSDLCPGFYVSFRSIRWQMSSRKNRSQFGKEREKKGNSENAIFMSLFRSPTRMIIRSAFCKSATLGEVPRDALLSLLYSLAHKMSLQVRKPKHRGTKRATSFGARIYLGSCFTLEWGFAGTFDRQIGNLSVLATSGLINTSVY